MISINQIHKSYQNTEVLKDITAQLPNSGLISIVGPNGAGKSTLLSIIGRLLYADAGEVSIDGFNVITTQSDKLAQKLAILRQENHYTSRLTVEELVSFGRYPYSKGRLTLLDKEKINESIEFLNLQEYQTRYLDELSGGQRQRAYVAMVLCQDTQYLLLDEPLNNLDMKHSVIMMKLLKKAVQELNKTILLVIHDINFASVYSDYIIALKSGKLCYQGTPNEIMNTSILEDIFDTPITIKELNHQKIALYY